MFIYNTVHVSLEPRVSPVISGGSEDSLDTAVCTCARTLCELVLYFIYNNRWVHETQSIVPMED